MILRRKDGFTLIEVIVAIAVIGIIAIVLTNIISTSIKARSISEERLRILALCTSSMDEIKSNQSSFDSVNDVEAWLLYNGYSKQSGGYEKKDASSGITVEVYLNQSFQMDGLYEVKVVGKSEKTSQLSITTMIKGGSLN